MRYMLGDTETCGLEGPDATSSGVVEAAWLELDQHANIIGRASSLINPGRPIGERAMEVHGITEAMVFGKPTFASFMAAEWNAEPTVLICHNVPFDIKFYSCELQNLYGTFCTLAAARRYIKNTRNHKLATLAEELGLQTGTAHRAAGDVETTHQLLLHIMSLTGKTLDELVESQRKPVVLTHMPFGVHKGKSFLDIPVQYLRWIQSCGSEMAPDVAYSANNALNIKGQ